MSKEIQPGDGRHNNRGVIGRQWAVNNMRITTYIPQSWTSALERFGKRQSDATRNAIDAALHGNAIIYTGEQKTVKLATPLPCSVNGCNNDAFSASASEVTLYGTEPDAKQWLLQPICESCVQKVAQNYDLQKNKEK